MADITELTVVGDWRIVVQSRDAGWDQRVVAQGGEAGTQILGGSPGMTMDVYGVDRTPWTLRIEHNPGDGWSPNWLRPGPKNIAGTHITQVVESEDITTPASDRDFNDLVIRLEKLGMVDQPQRPFAVWPGTVQMTPEGVFETAFGRYLMAVRVRNVWTEPWPAGTRVAITGSCRSWLAAGGVTVVDAWSAADQAAVGQDVVGGRVLVGDLDPWESQLVYFKVDVSAARVAKHQVEVAVAAPVAEDPATSTGAPARRSSSPGPRTTRPWRVRRRVRSRDAHDGGQGARRRLQHAQAGDRTRPRSVRAGWDGSGPGGGGGPPGRGCSPRDLERLRRRLRAFLDGKDDDVCAIWRELQCCCAGGGGGPAMGMTGTGRRTAGSGLEFFAWPTVFDYRIDYRPEFAGQFGPIPYDDPWWKVLLLIIAAILALAAFVSAAADLANRSADTVIGTVTRSVLNAIRTATAPPAPAPATTGSVDAAVVTLNGSRGLTPSLFSYLDARPTSRTRRRSSPSAVSSTRPAASSRTRRSTRSSRTSRRRRRARRPRRRRGRAAGVQVGRPQRRHECGDPGVCPLPVGPAATTAARCSSSTRYGS